ncbi:MAG: hypothetical protein PVF17_14025 [Ignavibacteria bacterium]
MQTEKEIKFLLEDNVQLMLIEENFDRMIDEISSWNNTIDPVQFENEWKQKNKLIYQS